MSEPTALADVETRRCPECGSPLRTTRDLLGESLSLVAPRAQEFVVAFYQNVFTVRPDLVPQFPADILDLAAGKDSPGAIQREKVLGAVIALARNFDPDDTDSTEALAAQLEVMGRAHTRFYPRPSFGEYEAVGDALLETMATFAGDAWSEAYEQPWRDAYEFAAGRMIAAQATQRSSGRGRRRRVG